MGTNGFATVTLIDNGGASVVVSNQSVQFVTGTCSSGTVGQIVSTRNATTLNNLCGWGPGVEAAALAIAAGGTVFFSKAATATHGAATAVTHSGTGASVVTVTLDGTNGAFDTYFVEVLVTTAGTAGTSGQIQISLDATRTFSPVINLGTATTYAIPGTGITLNFTAASLVAGDTYTFSTTEPLWNTAGIQASLLAFQSSPYANQGFGSVHIPGVSSGATATTIGGYIAGWSTSVATLYSQAILSARDALVPTTWGGSGETEQTWMTSILADYAAVVQPRIAAAAAYWNMPSALTNPLGMVPQFRRSLAYAIAARTVSTGFTANRSWGRVKPSSYSGPLPQIVVNPAKDAQDGFVYHNEAINPGLNAGRFVSTLTRSYAQGVYVLQANNLAQTGAQVNSWPLQAVASVAETILLQVGQLSINDDVRLLKSGLMDPRDVATVQKGLQSAIDSNMTAQQMISSASVVVDGTQNLIANGGQVPVSCTLVQRQTILQVNITLQYINPALA